MRSFKHSYFHGPKAVNILPPHSLVIQLQSVLMDRIAQCVLMLATADLVSVMVYYFVNMTPVGEWQIKSPWHMFAKKRKEMHFLFEKVTNTW